jgi:NAD(P)H-hydrate epimerase
MEKLALLFWLPRACLRSGAGLVTTHVPKCGYDIMQTALPEAMVMTDFNSSLYHKRLKTIFLNTLLSV